MNSVNDIKRDLDAKLATQLNPEWIAACLTFLESTGIGGLPARPRLLNMVEDQLLVSNLEMSSLGCLPEDIPRRHGTTLRGQFLVQVQDCINVSEPSDKRYNHSSHRTLKLGLFDGKITISAMELTHIPQISMDMPAGFKMIIKDPMISRGILVLTKDTVKVLGGQVESLVANIATIKSAMQKSTLPKEWADSLGEIDDLPTNTRLDGDAPDQTQDPASPPRPQQAPVPVAPLHALQATNGAPSSPSVFRNGPSSGSIQTQNHAPSPPPPRPAAAPLSLGKRPSYPSQPQPSTIATPSSSVDQNRPSTYSAFPPPSSSSIMEDYEELLSMDVESLVKQRKSFTSTANAMSPPPPATFADTAPTPVEKELVEDYLEENDAVESVDAYIDRIESSQKSRSSIHDIAEWEAPDIEDMFASNGDYLIGSQDLIEPPDEEEGERENDDFDDWHMEVDGGNSPRLDEVLSPEKKKRKLAEVEKDDEDDEAAFFVSPSPPSHVRQALPPDETDDEEELMILSEAEFQTQVEKNTEVTLISELNFVTNHNRRYKVHATCTEVSIPEVLDGKKITWTVLLTDPSAEQLWVSVDPNLAKDILRVSSASDWLQAVTVWKDQGEEVLKERILELAKESLTGDVMISWSVANDEWAIISLA